MLLRRNFCRTQHIHFRHVQPCVNITSSYSHDFSFQASFGVLHAERPSMKGHRRTKKSYCLLFENILNDHFAREKLVEKHNPGLN